MPNIYFFSMKPLTAKVSNITWIIDKEYLDDEITVEEVLSILPTSTTIKILVDDSEELDDVYLDHTIADALYHEYGWCVHGYQYEILKKQI